MKFKFSASVAVCVLAGCQTNSAETVKPAVPGYPVTAEVRQIDSYHGTSVADPYRWLEADVRESAEVRSWVDAQQATTRSYLAQIDDTEGFAARLKRLWDYERRGVPQRAGDRYFFSYNDGLMNQNQVRVATSPGGAGRVLLDPNEWSSDGTTALASYEPSPDGRYLAYLIQEDGSDWRRARVLDLETGELLADDLQWLKFTALRWSADSQSFYYSRFPAPKSGTQFQSLSDNQTLYRHVVGTAQSADEKIYHDPEHPEWSYFATVSDDGAWLVIHVGIGTDDRNQVLIQRLGEEAAPRFLVKNFEQEYSFLGHHAGELLFKTDLDAPLGRVVRINPATGAIAEVVAEQGSALQSAAFAGHHLVLSHLTDAHTQLSVLDLEAPAGGLKPVPLPAIGTAGGFSGRAGDPTLFYQFSSYAYPQQVQRLNLASSETATVSASDTGVKPAEYVVTQRFAASRDGTRVPLFVIHRKGLALDGSQRTILYGYGGFDISLTPSYSTPRMAWLEAGGVYAIANLRGGGEYGNAWHQAGTKLKKQNVFDDFIAAAEHLIEAGYTSPERLAIMGGSNGGLLVGAVANQRPELFGAALPLVGVMDMLRFQRFTAGRYWVDDYGSSDDPEEFEALYAYSPYHNVRKGERYPATLVYTADTDDRVVPGHSFKYAARLQALAAPESPALLYVESNAGHGAGTPTSKLIRRYADFWTFTWHQLGG